MADGKNLVGVDIGASSVKVIQLKEAKGKLTVIKAGYAQLPPQTIVDGQVMNAPAINEAIIRIFTEHKISLKDAAIGVYGQSVIVRKITVPMMTDDVLAQQIEWEANQHIPFDIKMMSIDYAVLKRRPEQGQMDLLLVAAKKDEITAFANLIREAKLKPQVVDINAFTIQNIFERSYGLPEDQTFALLNVGASISSLNVVSKGVSAFTREIANAGSAITAEIQRQMGLQFDEAEALKLSYGRGEPIAPAAQAAIQQACESLAGEIQRSIDFYLATSGEGEISRVYLCGGSAYLPPLLQAIEKRARVPVALFDPMANIAVDKIPNEADLRARSSQMAVALGLALRTDKEKRADSRMIRINLLPGKKESRVASSGSSASGSAGNRWVAFAVAFLILEALGVFFWHLSLKSKLDGIMANNTKTQADIDVIRQKISKHDEVKAKLKDLRDREDAIAKLQAARTGPTATLIELSRVLTTGKGPTTDPDKLERLKRENPAAVPNINWDTRRLWLIDYKELDRAVKITGQARDGEDVSEFLRRVSLSDFFYDIKLQPATKAIDPATKLELVKFELSAKVKY